MRNLHEIKKKKVMWLFTPRCMWEKLFQTQCLMVKIQNDDLGENYMPVEFQTSICWFQQNVTILNDCKEKGT